MKTSSGTWVVQRGIAILLIHSPELRYTHFLNWLAEEGHELATKKVFPKSIECRNSGSETTRETTTVWHKNLRIDFEQPRLRAKRRANEAKRFASRQDEETPGSMYGG